MSNIHFDPEISQTENYINLTVSKVLKKVTSVMKILSADELIQKHVIDRKTNGVKGFDNFNVYYFKILKNIDGYSGKSFFRDFNKMYSLHLRGEFIDKLEQDKGEIAKMLKEERLADLWNRLTEEKEYGSLFTKLVHTGIPEKYTAIDNPIKKHFGLEHESYFIAMIVVSKAYEEWARHNPDKFEELKRKMATTLKVEKERLTVMKVMNVVFWSEANPVTEK